MAREIDGYFYTLRSSARSQSLWIRVVGDERFSDTFDAMAWKKLGAMGIFLLSRDGSTIEAAAVGRRDQRVATAMYRVVFTPPFVWTSVPIKMTSLSEKIDQRFRQHLPELDPGGKIPDKTWDAVLEALRELNPEFGHRIERLDAMAHGRFGLGASPPHVGHQVDAIGTAVDLRFGGEVRQSTIREMGLRMRPEHLAGKRSVMEVLDSSCQHVEASSIGIDKSIFPGLEKIKNLRAEGGGAVFSNKSGSHLYTLVIDRREGERVTGTDLLYYDDRSSSAVLVQYKEMRSRSGSTSSEPCHHPDSDRNFAGQLEQMRTAARLLGSYGETVPRLDDLRLHPSPVFFKFCDPPKEAALAEGQLVSGMYISIDHWPTVEALAVGSRGGFRIDRQTVPRSLSNTLMCDLIRHGWIGSRPVPFGALLGYIQGAINADRLVVLARTSEPRSPDTDSPGGYVDSDAAGQGDIGTLPLFET